LTDPDAPINVCLLDSTIVLAVFLGNPGRKYSRTRHNAGWLVLERLSYYGQLSWKSKFRGEYAQRIAQGQRFVLLRPLTFMNRSGECVREAAGFFKVKPEQILVVHDDIELDFGQISFKQGGGLGGHNGLRSLKESLGTGDFWRLRLGIDRPCRQDVSSYVLSGFSRQQQKRLSELLDRAAQMLEESLLHGLRFDV
jgi:PTH1 family peptidyl-tRNA hydrolase